MAGNYPDPPGPRMAWDRDGTQFYRLVSGVLTQLSEIEARKANSEKAEYVEDPGYSSPTSQTLIWFFPEPRDLVGIKLMTGAGLYPGVPFSVVEVSSDSTNGLDGTWSAVTGVTTDTSGGTITPGYRQNISAISRANVRALRIYASHGYNSHSRLGAAHIYGKPSNSGNRLEFWHPTLDEPLSNYPAWLDWGNRPRGSTATRYVRVKNISGLLTASPITVGMEALADAPLSVVSQHSFSLDDSTFTPTVTIPSLAPGEISPVIAIKQALFTNADLSVWAQRVYANAGAWA